MTTTTCSAVCAAWSCAFYVWEADGGGARGVAFGCGLALGGWSGGKGLEKKGLEGQADHDEERKMSMSRGPASGCGERQFLPRMSGG